MKRCLAVFTALLLVAACAGADTYVKRELHTDGYYRGGQVVEPEDSIHELWIGEERLAYLIPEKAMIIDMEKGLFTFVNHRDRNYVQTELPLDMSALFSAEELGQLQRFARKGTVKATDEKKTIDDRDCACYRITQWIPYEGSRYNETDIESWVTTDVPFDLKMYAEARLMLGRLSNLGDELLKALKDVEGLELSSSSTRYTEGMAIRSTDRVVELAEKEAPGSVFSVPEGYTKKEKLAIADLR